MDERQLWIGTYTHGQDGEGAGVYGLLRRADGSLEPTGLAAETPDPSYLVTHPALPVLYAANERADGAVTAYAIDGPGRLRRLGERPVPAGPCHLAVRGDGRELAVASYSAGALTVQPLDGEGHFTGEARVHHGAGSGPRTDRQDGPHVHAVAHTPDGALLSTDLGADVVRVRRGGDEHEVRLPAGCGPRHLVVHPGGHVHVLTELARTVLVLTPDGRGSYTVTGESPATAAPTGPGDMCAAIRLSADGRYLYTSVREADLVTTHAVADGGASLKPVADTPCGGRWPRDMLVDGPWLYVAHQYSGTVTVLRLDTPDGVPVRTGHTAEVPSPVCVAL